MLDFQQKRKIRSLMYNRVTIGILFVIVLFVLHSTWSVYRKNRESLEMKNVSLKHVEELRTRREELDSKIARLSTDTGIEEEIRSKFSVAKDNEALVIIVEEKEASSTTTEKGFWEKITSFFGKK